jgi:hypothetical protein
VTTNCHVGRSPPAKPWGTRQTSANIVTPVAIGTILLNVSKYYLSRQSYDIANFTAFMPARA